VARLLPPHLSQKSALVLLPRRSISPPIEAVRRVRDKHFARWPPHINLLYPFLASPSQSADPGDNQASLQLKPCIRLRIQEATKALPSFHVRLRADSLGVFSHAPRRETVWLDPATQRVQQLQAALQAEFAECDADQRPYTPHLSVGQANSIKGAQQIGEEIKDSITNFLATKDGQPASLDWLVDQVYVLERNGYHGRFKLVGSIGLGNAQQ
jgi:2'-5' RNA ligase